VADAVAYIQRLNTLSADTLAVLTRHADIRYGPGPKETFDLYPAATAGPTPVHVFFHGGYWRAQDKTDFAFVARDLVRHGQSVAVVNYDLCPAVTVADIVADCSRCVSYIVNHGDDPGLDPVRLSVSGHSAA